MRIVVVLLLTLFFAASLPGQSVYSVRETLYLPDGVPVTEATLYARLPRNNDRQTVSQVVLSQPPAARPGRGEQGAYRWNLNRLTEADSLHFSYRVQVDPVPAWDGDSLLQGPAKSFAWPADRSDEPYIIPPLNREDARQTELSTLNASDTTVADVDRLVRRLGRRVKTVRSTDEFDYGQPLLADLYRRRTTPRRKHLLLSLALQYLDVPHRVVSGKVLSYGEVRENEVWVEIPVDGKWYRVYYGDGVDRSEWGAPTDPDLFLACTFDWRDYTLEVVSAVDGPPVPTTLSGEYSNVVLDFWIAKDEALARKRYSQALVHLDSVLTYLPRSVVAVSEVGLVYAQAGRPQDGIEYLQRAMGMAVTPADKSLALVQMAKYYSLQERAEESLQALARAYRITPIDLSVIYTDPRFQFLARQGNLEARLSAYLRQLD
ncbi:tetratricopeptide repeat protein [Neolewinella litorea]|uniref:Tetratricopeptide repeat protein n=1 Tax=Neolewinella litorea TaxID=2562452 RepID=A0A4S4NDE5_9BACT|nr:tetratricopeptide repeat protein [Neolewinella litorea]THH36547.1 tetratricopeptide repeat protein [Neolewinella litorea]